jgi:hypothetical protein
MTSSEKTHDQDRPRQQYVLRYEHRRQVSRRFVGAEAVIGQLLAGRAIGLVTTHDLELTRIVDQFTLAHRPSFARLPRPWG